MIRIFVIEDHIVTTAGIRTLFRQRDGIYITKSATRIDEALMIGDVSEFDLILLDLWLQSTNPLDNIRQLKEKFPRKPIVIFTSEDSFIWQEKMKDAGAAGYLLKTSSRHEIKTALEYIISGQAIFNISLDVLSFIDDEEKNPEGIWRPLTKHQKELITLMAEGMKQREIAKALQISLSTVEKIIRHLRDKYNVKSNTELIRLLTKNRLL